MRFFPTFSSVPATLCHNISARFRAPLAGTRQGRAMCICSFVVSPIPDGSSNYKTSSSSRPTSTWSQLSKEEEKDLLKKCRELAREPGAGVVCQKSLEFQKQIDLLAC